MHKYHDQLEADFQQYYNLDIATVDRDRASRLACQLPKTSRVMIVIDKANLWSNADVQLLQIANAIEVIKWQIGNQGRKRAKTSPPKPFIPKELKDLTTRMKRSETAKKQDLELHTIDEMKELLSRPRK